MIEETLKLPPDYKLEATIREQLGTRPGHQRCVFGTCELLLIVHEVPKAGVPERHAIFFWKKADDVWLQPDGSTGLGQLSALLDRYARAIDSHEEELEITESTERVFHVLRHAAPLTRSTRHISEALDQVLSKEPDDRVIRDLRDRARELERAAELLQSDARETLIFWQAESSEEQAKSSARLGRILFKLNLVTGFFLPLVAFGGLFGMNVDLPDFTKDLFWFIFFGGLMVGAGLLLFISREREK